MGSLVGNMIWDTVGKGVEALAGFNRKRLAAPVGGNPFLTGIHTPMDEELTLFELSVTGTIPAGLDGRYLRIGPNPVNADPASYHWFIGDGMVHGVAIEAGKALWYRNRWIRSNAVAKALGKEPAPGPRHRFDTVNTNVVGIAGRTFALVEGGSYPVELREDLADQAYDPFHGSLQGSFTAHPHLDRQTGENHAICYDGRDPGIIRHVVVDVGGQVVREEPVSVRHGPMIHDCAITDRFVVILDLPVTFSMKTLIEGHGFPYRWNPEHPARVGLLPRHGTEDDIVWCSVPPGYAFHVANAYDAPDGRAVLDLCVYHTMFDDAVAGPNSRCRGLERWTIDPVRQSVEIETIDSAAQEFPRIDERFFGQPHRFVWSIATPEVPSEQFIGATAIFAHDTATGARTVHDFGPGRFPGEFVFVPENHDAPEGHGWLIGLVVDLPNEATDLVILDARRFAEESVATIHLPHRIPPGFHGNWFPAGSAQ